jgi:UrcA family protein
VVTVHTFEALEASYLYQQSTVEESGMSNFKSFVLLAAGAVASVGTVGAAIAADSFPKMVVHFSQEDLNSEEGIQKVYQRIRRAAEDVCPAIETGTYLVSERTLKCRQTAIASAVDAIHNKRLAEVASASKKSA